jgi:hypothetical protein
LFHLTILAIFTPGGGLLSSGEVRALNVGYVSNLSYDLFRPLKPAVETEGCVAWKGETPSAPLKSYVEIVEHVSRSIR